MSEIRLAKFKFLNGGERKWREWSDELKRRSDEVMETLRNEGVTCEACFIDPETNSVFYLMEAESFKKAEEAYKNSEFPIDFEHRKIRNENLEKICYLEELFHFNNPQGSNEH